MQTSEFPRVNTPNRCSECIITTEQIINGQILSLYEKINSFSAPAPVAEKERRCRAPSAHADGDREGCCWGGATGSEEKMEVGDGKMRRENWGGGGGSGGGGGVE